MAPDPNHPMRVITREEFNAMFVDRPPAADDNVSITTDGRRLDSKEAVLEFIAELDELRRHRER